MSSLSYQTLEQLWVEAGGPPSAAATAAAIAVAESGGDPSAVQKGQPYATTGWGLWQITPGNSEPQIGTDQSLLTPLNNAKAAVAKFKDAGNSFTPWTTYTSGAYKRYLNGNDYSGTGTVSDGSSSTPPQVTGVFVWQPNLGPINMPIDMDGFVGIVAILAGGFIWTIGVIVLVASMVRRPLVEAVGIGVATQRQRQRSQPKRPSKKEKISKRSPVRTRERQEPTEEEKKERQAKSEERLKRARARARERELGGKPSEESKE